MRLAHPLAARGGQLPTRLFAAALVAAVLALAPAPAAADDAVTLDYRIEYYDVRGNTEPQIARSLRRDAPRALRGFQGEARFWFAWTFDYVQTGVRRGVPQCRVENARVEVEVVITLPRHRTIARAPAGVQATWAAFSAALERHEHNHGKDFVSIGSRIPRALNGTVAPCSEIEDVANGKGMSYVERAQRAADDYDARTNHGETEGTFFPGITAS